MRLPTAMWDFFLDLEVMRHQGLTLVCLSSMGCLRNDFFDHVVDCLVSASRNLETHGVSFLGNCFLYNFIYSQF